MIIIHHCRASIELLNNTILGSILTASGYLVVGIFFFLTGYGLRESAHNKQRYREMFFQHRIIPYYVDCIFLLIVYIIYRCIAGMDITASGLIRSLTVGGTYIINGWYLQTALIIYLGFWLVYMIKRLCSSIDESVILKLMFLLYFCLLIAESNMLCAQSIVGIWVGYVWSEKKNEIDKVIAKHYAWWLFGSFVGFGLTLVIGSWYSNGTLQIIIRSISVVCFINLILAILMVLPIRLKGLKFVGNISLELYAIHGLWIAILDKEINSIALSILFSVIVLGCSTISAVILHAMIKKMNSWLNGKLIKSI